MFSIQRIRRDRAIREAEGYLDLLMSLADRWPLTPAIRDPLAQRVLTALEGLEEGRSQRAYVYYLKGQALRIMDRFREAIEPLEKSSQISRENLHVWLALAWCYKRIGRLDMAIQSLEEALGVDSGEAIVHYNLACYWSLARNVKLAVEYLSHALEIDPNYRELIPREADFDPIRDEPGFQAILSVIV